MSDLYDAEEADTEAAERLRLAEWAAEHQNPLTAALQRAEHAEERARRAEAKLAAREYLELRTMTQRSRTTQPQVLRRDGGEHP